MDFSKMTVIQLKAYAKENGIKFKSNLNKSGLVELLEKHAEITRSDEEEEEDDNQRPESSWTVKQVKAFAESKGIKIPSKVTRKDLMIEFVNGYLDELDIGYDPTETGETKVKYKKVIPVYADLEKYKKFGKKAFAAHLMEHGWTVVPEVLSPEFVQETTDEFFRWLSQCSAETPINPEDPETWSYDAFPHGGPHGIIKNYIGQETFIWNVRREVKPVFDLLYTPKKGDPIDLVSSYDGAVFSLPNEKETFNSWFHSDYPRDMDLHAMTCVQGIACLTDSFENDGGFCFILPPEENIGDFLERYYQRHPSSGIVWGKMNMNDEEISKCDIYKICANAGDVILFDSRLIHCNAPPRVDDETANYRMAVYVSFQPRDNVEEETATARIKLFEEGRMSGHWCFGSWFSPAPKDYHSYGKSKIEPPDLNQPDYDDVKDMI